MKLAAHQFLSMVGRTYSTEAVVLTMVPICDHSGSSSRPDETWAVQLFDGKKLRRVEEEFMAPIDIPARLVRFTPVETRGLEPHFAVADTGCHNVIRNVRRVLPVVSPARLRQFHSARAMRIRHPLLTPDLQLGHNKRPRFLFHRVGAHTGRSAPSRSHADAAHRREARRIRSRRFLTAADTCDQLRWRARG